MSSNDMSRRITESKPEGRRTRDLGGKFFRKPRLILGCSADYDNDDLEM
jgi:hypothetical protein